ncbi:MAG TPA: ABC transporter permease [Candidatus Pullichristensenella excrementipullorum]|nr:ABC transporter permease [Candidatus Pullichristensenella excrementipullorum]
MSAFRSLTGSLSMMVESVRMSVSNIRQNRMRSFLTILGIMIGVTAVIALVTTISGVSSSISDSFSSMGASTMTLSATGTDLQGGLTAENMEEISELDHVEGVSPSVSLSVTAARGDAYESGVSVSGRNDDYFVQEPDTLSRGRAINSIDLDQSLRVCLISEELVETFFYGDDPIGQELYLDGMRFTVVGVLAADADSSVSSMFSSSNAVIVPYTTALKMNGETLVTSLTLYLGDANAAEVVEAELETCLDAIFDYEDDTYSIITMESIADTMESMLSMMSALLGGIASIALLVGGIGIMNMMLTSVTERTVEIGLKKAIGARPGQIQAQFLIESFLLSMVGGLAGVVLGIALSAILCQVLGTGFSLSYGAIALGVGFSAAVGVLFGWSPARKASRLNPIDALRRM